MSPRPYSISCDCQNSSSAVSRVRYHFLSLILSQNLKARRSRMLLGKVWGPEYGEEREHLRVFIGRLRRHLEPKPENPKYIISIPGVCYRSDRRLTPIIVRFPSVDEGVPIKLDLLGEMWLG